ncbi:hypothetical protein HPPN120_06105 [Helicobacter pylori Puno120]|nr:hypothetical protein HPPN120_06105 [Helicobacter pylori Puno120]
MAPLISFNPLLILKNGFKTPKNLFFFETTKRQISAKILSIHAILTKSCDKISCFYRT